MKFLFYILTPKFLADVFCFVFAKGIAFFIPLLLVRVITLADFGMLETSFAWGQQLTMVLVLGLPSAYPFFILKKRETSMQVFFWAYGCLLFLLACVAVGFFCTGVIPKQLCLILLLTTLFAMERILSSILKTHGLGRIGVLVDSFYYFALAGAAVTFFLMPEISFFAVLFCVLFFLLVGLEFWFGVMLRKRIRDLKKDSIAASLRSLFSYSIPLIFSGLIIYWLVVCPRIYLSLLLGNEIVGIYSFCFRIFAISILIYQFSYIMFFKKLYIVKAEKLDRNFSILLGLVFVSSAICFLAFLWVKQYFRSVEYARLPLVAMELGCLMPIWCATALNEGIVARENQVVTVNLALVPQIIIFPALIYYFRSKITLENFCTWHLCSCTLVFFSQSFVLMQKKIYLWKSSMIIGGVTLLAVFLFFIYP